MIGYQVTGRGEGDSVVCFAGEASEARENNCRLTGRTGAKSNRNAISNEKTRTSTEKKDAARREVVLLKVVDCGQRELLQVLKAGGWQEFHVTVELKIQKSSLLPIARRSRWRKPIRACAGPVPIWGRVGKNRPSGFPLG